MQNARLVLAAIAAACLGSTSALAQDYYASFSVGSAQLSDSDNEGAFVGDFVTGEGTTIPAGTVLPDGTPFGWATEFDSGFAYSAAFGRRFGAWRAEVELARQSNDVDTHNGVQAAGIPLDNEDAGVLITGSPNLGVTVGALVDDGQGAVEATYLMANLYRDFDLGGPFTPYVGAGIGAAFVDVDYSPSGVGIVDDDDQVLAYQAIVGASLDLSERLDLFAQYRYRATGEVGTAVDLFDANLDIENRSSVFEAGVRLSF